MKTYQKVQNILRICKQDILEMCDTREESLREVHRYKAAFPKEPDYNIAAYGNVRISYNDVEQAFKKAGYTSTGDWSNQRLWGLYRWYIGQAADKL